MRIDLRPAIGFTAGLFQGPAFLWGQLAPLVAATTGEAAWVRWSPLGLTLALVFGLLVLLDRLGARPMILTVCMATLVGGVLLAVGGAGAAHARTFAVIAVIGSFIQLAATRAGVLVTAHETRGVNADQQLSGSRGLAMVCDRHLPATLRRRRVRRPLWVHAARLAISRARRSSPHCWSRGPGD